MFRKYHYLNTDLHIAARQFVGVVGDEIVAHTGVIYFPMRKGWKRIHRFVVLPDYQGIGIGVAFIEKVSDLMNDEGFEVNLTTTTPALVKALTKNPNWRLSRFGRTTGSYGSIFPKDKNLDNASSKNRVTYSFNYKCLKK